MIFLGLDLGQRRVGVAISHGVVAQSLDTFEYDEKNPENLAQKIKKIINEQKVDKIIVGIPLGKEGKDTAQGVWTKNQADKLEKILKVPFEFTEESFSSSEALSQIDTSFYPKKIKNQKGLVDRESARIILQQYLNENSDSSF